MFRKATGFLLIVAANILLGQQQNPKTISLWTGYGIGYSFLDEGYSLNSFQFSVGGHINNVSLKYIYTTNNEVLHQLSDAGHSSPAEFIDNQAFQLGVTIHLFATVGDSSDSEGGETNLRFYSGYSIYNSLKRGREIFDGNFPTGNYERLSRSGHGIPIEIEYEHYFDKYWGVTANYHFDINDFRNYYSLQVNLVIRYMYAP